MKAKDAVKLLSHFDPEEELLIDWLSKESFAVAVPDSKNSDGFFIDPTEEQWLQVIKEFNLGEVLFNDGDAVTAMRDRLKALILDTYEVVK